MSMSVSSVGEACCWPSSLRATRSYTSRTKDRKSVVREVCGCVEVRASDMVLAGHADDAYLNVSKARSRAGAYIMLSEDVPVPAQNGPVLTIANIILKVVSSAAEAEVGG